MFQLVATKIFELRIMESYRDKVALEKQQLLIQEEEEDQNADKEINSLVDKNIRLHKVKKKQHKKPIIKL